MQIGTITTIPGAITAAQLFVVGTDTLIATAVSVVAAVGDPSLYTITFSGVNPGTYRLSLFAGAVLAAIEPEVLVTIDGWTLAADAEVAQPETVATALDGPAAITIDGVSVQNRSIPDMIAGERHAAANQAAANGAPFGLGFAKLRPGSGRGT